MIIRLRPIFLSFIVFSVSLSEAQFLSNIKSWWSNYGSDEASGNSYSGTYSQNSQPHSPTKQYNFNSNSQVKPQISIVNSNDAKYSDANDKKISIVKYGEWTSAPSKSHFTTKPTRSQSVKFQTTTKYSYKPSTASTTKRPTIIRVSTTQRFTTSLRTTKTTTKRITTTSTTTTTTTKRTSTARSSTASTRVFGFYDNNLLDHTTIFLTTPSTARKLSIETKSSFDYGDWTPAPALDQEGEMSLFDLENGMTPKSELMSTTKLSSNTEPSTTPTFSSSTMESLFDATEIFYENFTMEDSKPHFISTDFKDIYKAITENKTKPFMKRFPPLPLKFKEVLKNHTGTNVIRSLFDEESSLKQTTESSSIVSSITPTTETSKEIVEKTSDTLFSDNVGMKTSNMFTISRTANKDADTESLILGFEKTNKIGEKQVRRDDSLDSRFGLTRPKIRGFVLKEVERSSSSDKVSPKTMKIFKNHNYHLIKHSKKNEMTIEQILDASRARKGFDLSKRVKTQYPVYVNKGEDLIQTHRGARQHNASKNIHESPFPFPFQTSGIFYSGTGHIESLDSERRRSLFGNTNIIEESDGDDDGTDDK